MIWFLPLEFLPREVPTHIEGVPDEILMPRKVWKDPQLYDTQARDR